MISSDQAWDRDFGDSMLFYRASLDVLGDGVSDVDLAGTHLQDAGQGLGEQERKGPGDAYGQADRIVVQELLDLVPMLLVGQVGHLGLAPFRAEDDERGQVLDAAHSTSKVTSSRRA